MDHPEIAIFAEDGHVRTLEDIEADIFRLALCVYGGRAGAIARNLHIGRSTFYRKLSSLGITPSAAISPDLLRD